MQERMEEIQQELEDSVINHEEETLMTDTYLYMKDRIKQDLIKMKISSNKMEDNLKNKSQLFDAEVQKTRTTNAGKI